jgi:hypothetical protein
MFSLNKISEQNRAFPEGEYRQHYPLHMETVRRRSSQLHREEVRHRGDDDRHGQDHQEVPHRADGGDEARVEEGEPLLYWLRPGDNIIN